MTFISTQKPNSIVFNDSIYNGSKAFKHLFYESNDQTLITLYKIHQFNKVLGNFSSSLGALTLSLGVIYASSDHANISRTTGWIMTGGGFISTILGGYLISRSNANLIIATKIFNDKYATENNSLQLNVGVSDNGLGMVFKW